MKFPDVAGEAGGGKRRHQCRKSWRPERRAERLAQPSRADIIELNTGLSTVALLFIRIESRPGGRSEN